MSRIVQCLQMVSQYGVQSLIVLPLIEGIQKKKNKKVQLNKNTPGRKVGHGMRLSNASTGFTPIMDM